MCSRLSSLISSIPRKFYSPLIIIFVLSLPFVLVNGLTFNRDTFTIEPKDIFSLSWVFNLNKVKLYLSMIPIFTLIIAYITWVYNKYYQRVADINGLIEELRHNINLCDSANWQISNKSGFYKQVYIELKHLKYYEIYPCDTLSRTALLPFIKPIPRVTAPFIKLRNDFITSAISSKSYYHLSQHRIFLNLGHLNYSILRHNLNIDVHNASHNEKAFDLLQTEYLYWLHCRLHFMLVDLITSVDKREIIDNNYLDTMTAYIMGR